MATSRFYLAVAVMAMVSEASYGLSILSPSFTLFGDVMKGELFRQTRDVTCPGLMHCIMNDGHYHFVHNILEMNLANSASDFSTQCEDSHGFDCSSDGCPRLRGFLEFMNSSLELACDHQEGFQNGTDSSCWGTTFHTEMHACMTNHSAPPPLFPGGEDLLECFATVPRNLSNCTPGDEEFVVLLTSGIVNLMREAH